MHSGMLCPGLCFHTELVKEQWLRLVSVKCFRYPCLFLLLSHSCCVIRLGSCVFLEQRTETAS
jgi:hypothetical protein